MTYSHLSQHMEKVKFCIVKGQQQLYSIYHENMYLYAQLLYRNYVITKEKIEKSFSFLGKFSKFAIIFSHQLTILVSINLRF